MGWFWGRGLVFGGSSFSDVDGMISLVEVWGNFELE